MEFVVRASRGESLSSLCREYEISRPTGYLWLKRFGEQCVAGVEELSRRPHLSPRRTAAEIEVRIVALRRQRPDWGARKLAVLLEPEGLVLPVITVHRVLLRHDLVLDMVWLMRQGVRRYFSGIRHPPTGVPTDRSWSVGWRRGARWSGFTNHWSARCRTDAEQWLTQN
ncbi:MAG: helix-turn-helix domain-containing protein [Terracidiphilus sp.]